MITMQQVDLDKPIQAAASISSIMASCCSVCVAVKFFAGKYGAQLKTGLQVEFRTLKNSPYSSGQISLASCQNDAGHVRGYDSRTELAHLGNQMRKHFPHEARHRLPNSRACQHGTGATQPPPEVPQQSIRIAALAEEQIEREPLSPSNWVHPDSLASRTCCGFGQRHEASY